MASFLKEELQQTDNVGKPSSCLLRDFVMRWSWGCCHFLSFVFSFDACFVFDFVVFYLWVNSDNITHWQSGWFQIPYLGLCPPSIDWKISLISLAKYLASLIWEHIFFQIYTDLSKFGFTLIVFFSFSEKYANFIHRMGSTVYDCKTHG